MKGEDIKVFGLYRLYWNSGGFSLASVGGLHNGTRWFAPANWTSPDPGGVVCCDWDKIERAELVEAIGDRPQPQAAIDAEKRAQEEMQRDMERALRGRL
jgi:hypothetical protein